MFIVADLVSLSPIIRQLCLYGLIHMTRLRPYKPGVLYRGTYANHADPDQTPQKAASVQDLHCLLTKCCIKV